MRAGKLARKLCFSPIQINPNTPKMALSMKPLADRVIVRAAAAEEKTKSGIIIPDTAKEKPQRGEVVAVGEGKTSDSGSSSSRR